MKPESDDRDAELERARAGVGAVISSAAFNRAAAIVAPPDSRTATEAIEAVSAFLRNLDPATRRRKYVTDRGWVEDADAKPASAVIRALPEHWHGFVKERLEPLKAELGARVLAVVGEFVGSESWWGFVVREEILKQKQLPRRDRHEALQLVDRLWWEEILGYFRRDGRDRRGRKLLPELRFIAERLGNVLEREMSEHERARFIEQLFAAILPLRRAELPGAESIRQALRGRKVVS
jgi:hypothetical protein